MQQNLKIWWLFSESNGEYDFEYKNDKLFTWVTWYDHIWKEPMHAKKWSNFTYIAITFEILVQNQ